jgi:ABC-type transport system involved in multi-copper enzyme maturation permease subunit
VFWTLLRKELAEQVLSGRLLIALALFLILLPLSSILLLEQRERQLEDIKPEEEGQKEVSAWLAKQENPVQRFTAFAQIGVTEVRRPPELCFLAQGLDRVIPRTARIRAKAGEYLATCLESDKPTTFDVDNPILERFPVADTVYLVTVVGAPLAIFASFDAICRERELGTLKLLFANPVRRGTVILAKWTAAFLSVGLGLVLATLVVLAYILVTGSLVLTGGLLGRWGIITAAGLVYLALFSALGVSVSALVATRRGSLLIGLALWLTLVLVLPGVTAAGAQGVLPLPERPRMQMLWKEYNDAIIGRRDARLMADMKDLVPEDEERLRLVEVHERKAEEQRRLFSSLSRVTPSALYIWASTEVAGTGATYYDGFRRADQELTEAFRAYVIPRRPDARAGVLKPADADVAAFPTFSQRQVFAAEAVAAAGWDLAALLTETMAILVAAVFLFVRQAEL